MANDKRKNPDNYFGKNQPSDKKLGIKPPLGEKLTDKQVKEVETVTEEAWDNNQVYPKLKSLVNKGYNRK